MLHAIDTERLAAVTNLDAGSHANLRDGMCATKQALRQSALALVERMLSVEEARS